MNNLWEISNLIKKIYKEKVGGNPDDLVRVYEKENTYHVTRNDDTETALKKEDIINQSEENIAIALKNFTLIE